MMEQQRSAKNICTDLAWHGIKASWFIDPYGELFLVLDDKWLMRCIGERKIWGEVLPYWIPVRPTYKSMFMRHIKGAKLEYVPVFEKDFNA